jgi:colanic acid/amylovoran biosynthesis glycosyltransferase
MKIVFLIPKFPKLSETFILNQITGLVDMGHDVQIFARSRSNDRKIHSAIDEYELVSRVKYFSPPNNKFKRIILGLFLIITNIHKNPKILLRSVNVFRFRKDALTLKLLFLAVLFMENNYDIIQCHFGKMGNIACKMKLLGVKGKIVIMFHGADIRKGIKSNGSVYTDLIEYGDCFQAISKYNYDNLVNFGISPDKIVRHPVGINPVEFTAVNRPKNTTDIIILTVARLVEEKGLKYAIEAICRVLNNNGFNTKYLIAGSGYLERELKNLTHELGIEKNIVFLGEMTHDEIIELMGKASIFILPSIAEALPVVLMEAQVSGLPVIATNVGSISEIILDNESGFIVPPMDSGALAEKLEYLLKNPEKWPLMGAIGRKHIEKKFDILKLNKKLVDLYSRLTVPD